MSSRKLPGFHLFFPVATGLFFGTFYAMRGYKEPWITASAPSVMLIDGLALIALMPASLLLLRHLVSSFARRLPDFPSFESRFFRLEKLSYAPCLVSAAFLGPVTPNHAVALATWVAIGLLQILIIFAVMGRGNRLKAVSTDTYIGLLFLISGFSALIYQVVWQRVLFNTFGVNTESVTAIVSTFMFGLGIGAIAGNYLLLRFRQHLLHVFLALEIGVGVFGIFSVTLIDWVGQSSVPVSTLALLLRVYAVLALPTLLMGATLPVLVGFLERRIQNMGRTVGLLYAFNTFGSAIAAFATVQILFVLAGLQASVFVAVACNLVTAGLIFHASRHLELRQAAEAVPPPEAAFAGERLTASQAFALLALIGFISLSQEILWFRILGFLTGSHPQVFGMLLAAFLAGVAWGSIRARNLATSGASAFHFLVTSLLAAALVFYAGVPVIAFVAEWAGSGPALLCGYLLVAFVACLCGGVLPVTIHLGTRDARNSLATASWLYFSNILGSAVGPLLTGFIALEVLSLEANVAALSGLTLLLALTVLFLAPSTQPGHRFKYASLAAGLAVAAVLFHDRAYENHLEKMQYASSVFKPFKYTLENRSGVLTVEEAAADVMYGHGIYDGRFNIDPVNNTNLIDRAFMVAALHRQPQKVLEIGLSTASWTRVLSSHTAVGSLTVVEINKGYPAIVRNYPEMASVLESPRVRLLIDDGRRWLRSNPDESFDVIVMNNTLHWRSNATSLLSLEFLKLCKQHLKPGGVLYYNTTGADDVVFTAAHGFSHVTRYSTFVAASDHPFDMTPAERRANLLKFAGRDGKPLLDSDEEHRKVLARLSNSPLTDIQQDVLQRQDRQLITDDNMAVEYKQH
ncbi:MAG: fused MFS/spermidine synthase [Ramlibacter sp.]|nr:fused MFS/spermidine synthase [Ramlibacter sp.]